MNKSCNHCGEHKPIEEFGFDRAKDDGHSNRCMVCTRAAIRRSYHRNRLKERIRCWARRYNNPLAIIAKNAIRLAIYHGTMVKPDTCAVCGKKGDVDCHHPDYTKPNEFIPLCVQHHSLVHRGLRKIEGG